MREFELLLVLFGTLKSIDPVPEPLSELVAPGVP
jgi:hypothetical protein